MLPARSIIPKPSDREEWLAVRRPYFNASATAVLFDRHPFLTPGDYATVKLTGVEQAPTRAMRRGVHLEDAIARWWSDEHGFEVVEPDVMYAAGCVLCTVDRWAIGEDECPIEIKTTGHRVTEPARYWLDQCQSIMLCTGKPVCRLIWLDPSMDLHEILVVGDDDLQAEIITRAERFMAAIDFGIIPDWVELSYRNVAALHPEPAGVAELSDEDVDLVRELATLRQVRKEAERDEENVKDKLAKLLGDHEVGTWHGFEVLSWRPNKPSQHFDEHMFSADYPDLFEKYQVEKLGNRPMVAKLEVSM